MQARPAAAPSDRSLTGGGRDAARTEAETAGAVIPMRIAALPRSGLMFKLPIERLCAVDGTPGEAFIPQQVTAN